MKQPTGKNADVAPHVSDAARLAIQELEICSQYVGNARTPNQRQLVSERMLAEALIARHIIWEPRHPKWTPDSPFSYTWRDPVSDTITYAKKKYHCHFDNWADVQRTFNIKMLKPEGLVYAECETNDVHGIAFVVWSEDEKVMLVNATREWRHHPITGAEIGWKDQWKPKTFNTLKDLQCHIGLGGYFPDKLRVLVGMMATGF